jgi:hypothetical protein
MSAVKRVKTQVLALCIALGPAVVAQAPPGFAPGRRVLLDAHNAYPYQGRWSDRVERAIAAGTPIAIEQDLVWLAATATKPARSIVSHGEPFTGDEPTLRDFFERIRPIVTRALAVGSRERWPLITLNLDFKDSHPQHFAAIWDLLGDYEAWLTTAKRVEVVELVEPLRVGPVLVLTGSDPAQQTTFHDSVPIGSPLRLFGAVLPVVAASGDIAQKPVSTNYRRWSNNPWSAVEPEGQNSAGDWTAKDADRLHLQVRAAHDAGLWIRYYTLNGHTTEHGERMGWSPGYNFTSIEAARVRWRAAIDAGVDFVATDQYEDFAHSSSR